jgi:very-short-patch-repair endonuclease
MGAHRAFEMTENERDYLTEISLGRFLRERLDADVLSDLAVPGVVRRYRPDYRSEQHRLIIEFYGDEHYRSAKKILGDAERDATFTSGGYRVVRIPYFVQLKRAVIADLFGDLVRITPTFWIFRMLHFRNRDHARQLLRTRDRAL